MIIHNPNAPDPPPLHQTDYEGWSVVLRDGSRVYEAVPWNPNLLQLAPGAKSLPVRGYGRNTRDFLDVKWYEIQTLEVYFSRDTIPDQPAVLLERAPGADKVRFFQFKMGAVKVSAGGGGDSGDRLPEGQARQGTFGYRVGYWNPHTNECQAIEVTRKGSKRLPVVAHPCWPRPYGYGLAPYVVHLRDDEVPASPVGGTVLASR